jgi:hypothetical protein
MSAQHGFFKGRSTVTNSIEFTSYVLNCMENGLQVDAIYTAFSKTFDKVSHGLLLRKLAKLGFGVSFLDWIRSYLTGREQFVKATGSEMQPGVMGAQKSKIQKSRVKKILYLV